MSQLAVCPHCQKPGLSIRTHGLYSRGWPAVCRECQGLAYDRPHGIVTTLRFFFELFSVPLFFAFLLMFPRTVIYGALASIPLLIAYWWFQPGWGRERIPPFRPITREASHRSRQLTLLAIFTSIAAVVLFASFRR